MSDEDCLLLTEVLVHVAEEDHDEADGEEVDGEERRQRPARQPPRAQQLPGGGGQHGGVVVVGNVCGGMEDEISLTPSMVYNGHAKTDTYSPSYRLYKRGCVNHIREFQGTQ